MKDTILFIQEILKDRSYEMTPDLHKLLSTLIEDLDREVDTLSDLIPQMNEDAEMLSDCKVVEYAQFLTQKSRNEVFDEYGRFKLAQSIEEQLQHEMN
jgi:hypothetical protein